LAHPQPTTRCDDEEMSTRDVFTALADELERARSLGLRVEGAICAIAVRAAIDSSVVAELQQLDAVLQHLGALRDFAGEVSRACGEHSVVDVKRALDRITLAEVRARLSGATDVDDADGQWEML
jgi:hypothetical protein